MRGDSAVLSVVLCGLSGLANVALFTAPNEAAVITAVVAHVTSGTVVDEVQPRALTF